MTVTELKEALIELESEGHGALHVGIKEFLCHCSYHDIDYDLTDTVVDGIKLDAAKSTERHGPFAPLKDAMQFVRLEF